MVDMVMEKQYFCNCDLVSLLSILNVAYNSEISVSK